MLVLVGSRCWLISGFLPEYFGVVGGCVWFGCYRCLYGLFLGCAVIWLVLVKIWGVFLNKGWCCLSFCRKIIDVLFLSFLCGSLCIRIGSLTAIHSRRLFVLVLCGPGVFLPKVRACVGYMLCRILLGWYSGCVLAILFSAGSLFLIFRR